MSDPTPYLVTAVLLLGLACCVLWVAVCELSAELKETRRALAQEQETCNGYRATFRGVMWPLQDKEKR